MLEHLDEEQKINKMKSLAQDMWFLRNLYLKDELRPVYHLIAPEGHTGPSDTNGMIYWKGRYHLFYITQDTSADITRHCWAHVSSLDLVHWTHHPLAIEPLSSDVDYDYYTSGPGAVKTGIYSGCAFLNREGVPTIAYYGINSGMCLAFSTDDNLDFWRKSEHNPVLARPREGDENYGVYSVFDPDCWIDNGIYYSVQGDKPLGGGKAPYDTLYLFKSKDLIHWEYSHKLYDANPEWTTIDDDCACPSFYKIGDKHMLLFLSHARGAQYYVGRYENEKFYPEEHNMFCAKDTRIVSAPETMLDDKGRRIALFTLGSGNDPDRTKDRGFVTSLPVIFSPDGKGGVYTDPAEELEKLRFEKLEYGDIKIDAGKSLGLEGLSGRSMEIDMEIACGNGEDFQVRVACSPDKKQHTAVGVDRRRNVIYSINKHNPDRKDYELKLHLDDGENINLRIFVDRSVVEVFANRKQYLVERVYAPLEFDDIEFHSGNSSSKIVSIKKWTMSRA